MVNLVIQTAFIGDALLSIPLIRKLKNLYPRHHLALVCRKGLGDIFLQLEIVDEVFEVDKSDPASLKALKKSLKSFAIDNVICPHESVRSALLVKSLKAKNKIGFKKWWNFFAFHRRVERPMKLPDVLRQMSLLTALDDKFKHEFTALSRNPRVFNSSELDSVLRWGLSEIPEWASMNLRQQLVSRNPELVNYSVSKPVVFIAPGSVWATKRWHKQGFVELGRRLQRVGVEVCLVGSPEEAGLCEEIASSIPEARSLAGRTSLFETMQMFSFGQALITNDSGAMHLAAVAGLPTVAIFGPTTLDLGYRPWQDKSVVVQKKLNCRPCGKHGAQKCPLGTHECMQVISAEDVFLAYTQLTSHSKASPESSL